MDHDTHGRYLAYLNRYTYFGRGRERLTAPRFEALETELATLVASTDAPPARVRDLEKLLLKD